MIDKRVSPKKTFWSFEILQKRIFILFFIFFLFLF